MKILVDMLENIKNSKKANIKLIEVYKLCS